MAAQNDPQDFETALAEASPSTQRSSKVQKKGGQSSSSCLGPGLPKVPGKSEDEVRSLVQRSLCAGCGKDGHVWAKCRTNPANKGQVAGPADLSELPSSASCMSMQETSPVAHTGEEPALPEACIKVAKPCTFVPRLQRLTKHFDLLVGCQTSKSSAKCIEFSEFLSTMPEGHALIDMSTCSPLQTRQLIQHAQNCRKLKTFSAVYLLPSSKDAAWKSLLQDLPHIARERIAAKEYVHAYYQRPFVPDMTAWSCQLAGAPAQALNDGGAQVNFVSTRWLTKHGLGIPSSTISIALGDGSPATASGSAIP